MQPTITRLEDLQVAALLLPCGCLLDHWSESAELAGLVVRLLADVHICQE